MNLTLQGRRALVTGAGSDGIGRATAIALAHAGADVALHHVAGQEARVAETAREIAALGRRAEPIAADFSEVAAARALVREAEMRLGSLDILVCAAAILLRKPALEISDAEWTAVHTINLQAYFACAQEAARGMAQRGEGRIVMISSVNQWTPNVGSWPMPRPRPASCSSPARLRSSSLPSACA